jgi:hypothetical protein
MLSRERKFSRERSGKERNREMKRSVKNLVSGASPFQPNDILPRR